MKHKPIVIALALIVIGGGKALAQDAIFTQWENMPLYINPALTGNFEGSLRLRANHRNQWASILKQNSYKTTAVSADYKFPAGNVRKISIGAFGIQDKAGSLDFTNSSVNFSTSVIQHLGHPEKLAHSIAFGLNVGMATRKLDYENAQWPGGSMPPEDYNEKTNFADISTGLLWQYRSNTHFSFNLGTALHHLNKPNVSLFDSSVTNLNHRFNLHGHVEIPVVKKFSIVPSFLFSSWGPYDQLLYGFHNRWYPTSNNPNFVQLGLFARSTKSYNESVDPVYVVSVTVEIYSFLAGFSIEHFDSIESNAYEFTVGYTIRELGPKGTASKPGYLPPGIVP